MSDYILMVDDDEEVLGTLTRTLKKQGYEVNGATSGSKGLQAIKDRVPDLLILDIIMPRMTGLDVCRQLRADASYNTMPILFLSARNDTEDVVKGLDLGGDDYITKPFELTELNARVRSLLRRFQREPDGQASLILSYGELTLDANSHQLDVSGTPVQLTSTEYRLIQHMMENAGKVLSATHLLQHVWLYPENAGDPDLVRAHIRNLRAKIEENSSDPQYIKTVHGLGYSLVTPSDEIN